MDWVWIVFVAARGVVLPDQRWTPVLVHLDRVRAQAFAAGEADRLSEVYAPGSDLLREERRTIAAYARRGGRVVGADLEVLSCRPLAVSASRIRLDVVDRLRDAEVAWDDGSATRLPTDLATRHVVTLVRTPLGWRIAEVSPRPSSRR